MVLRPSAPIAHAGRVGAATFAVRIDKELRGAKIAVVAAERPISKIAGRKIAVGDKFERGGVVTVTSKALDAALVPTDVDWSR